MKTDTDLRVLVVDDSEDDVLFILRALRRGGYAPVSERVDTAEAMNDSLAKGGWDIILSDYDMPAFDALGAISIRNELRPDIPFIIVSGRIGEDAIVSMMKAGAQDYVLKRDLGRLSPAVERARREMDARAERQRAEAALRESEERYALAVRGSSDGLWDWNIAAGHVYYAPRFKEMLGFAEHEFPGVIASFEDRIHPDDRASFRAALEAHLDERAPLRVECRALTRDGEPRWFSFRGQALWDSQGKAVRAAGSLTDLTEQKRVEEELRDKLEIIGQQLEIIKEQQEAIRVLMAPVIQVWDGVLMTPVLGVFDRDRAAMIMDALLQAVASTRSRHVILDLTAVESIDATTADHVIKLVKAVELLGAQGIVVGVQPRVAMAIVSAGIDLPRVKTLANLREALLFCMGTEKTQRRNAPIRDKNPATLKTSL